MTAAGITQKPSWKNNLEKKFVAKRDNLNALLHWPKNAV